MRKIAKFFRNMLLTKEAQPIDHPGVEQQQIVPPVQPVQNTFQPETPSLSYGEVEEVKEMAAWIGRNWTGQWDEKSQAEAFLWLEQERPEWFGSVNSDIKVRQAIGMAAQQGSRSWSRDEIFEWVQTNGVDSTPPPEIVTDPEMSKHYLEAVQYYDNNLGEGDPGTDQQYSAAEGAVSPDELASTFIETWAYMPTSEIHAQVEHFRSNNPETTVWEYFSMKYSQDWTESLKDIFKDVPGGMSGNFADGRLSYFLPRGGTPRMDFLQGNLKSPLPPHIEEAISGAGGVDPDTGKPVVRSDIFRYLYENEIDSLSSALQMQVMTDPDIVSWVDSRLSHRAKQQSMREHEFMQDEEGASIMPEKDVRKEMLETSDLTRSERKERVNAQKGQLKDMMATVADINTDVSEFLSDALPAKEAAIREKYGREFDQGKHLGGNKDYMAWLKNSVWFEAMGNIIGQTVEEAFSKDPQKAANMIGVKWNASTGQIVPKQGKNEWDSLKWSKLVNGKSLAAEINRINDMRAKQGYITSDYVWDAKKEQGARVPFDLSSGKLPKSQSDQAYTVGTLILDKIGDKVIDEYAEKYPANTLLAFLSFARVKPEVKSFGSVISNSGQDERKSYLSSLINNAQDIINDTNMSAVDPSFQARRHVPIFTPPLARELEKMVGSGISDEDIENMSDEDVASLIYPFLMYNRMKYQGTGRFSSILPYKFIKDQAEPDSETNMPGEIWKSYQNYGRSTYKGLTKEEQERAEAWFNEYVPPAYRNKQKLPNPALGPADITAALENAYYIIKEAMIKISKLQSMRNALSKFSSARSIDGMIADTKRAAKEELAMIRKALND